MHGTYRPKTWDELANENSRLRYLLWLNHGCYALYGDDGEMQCGHCMIDFKRDSVKNIEYKLDKTPQPFKDVN